MVVPHADRERLDRPTARRSKEYRVSLKGVFNVYRRPNRSYEGYHRDKRRKNVDRLAILEARHDPTVRRRSAFREFVSAVLSIFRGRHRG
jgi:hypothetical protein